MDSRPSRGAARWHEDSEAEYARLAALGEAALRPEPPDHPDLEALRNEWRDLIWEAAVKGSSQGVLPADVRRRADGLFDRRAALPSEPPSREADPLREAAQEMLGAFYVSPGVTTGRQAKALDALRAALGCPACAFKGYPCADHRRAALGEEPHGQ